MFGFLRPGFHDKSYRQIYASYCARQRHNYGTCSSPFTSYEAIFLYLLAVEAGVTEAPADCTPTCCRFRSDSTNRWNLDYELADFCSAFALVLAAVKVEDDVRDSGSWLARGANYVLSASFEKARQTLDRSQPGLVNRIDQLIHDHVAIENAGEKAGTATDLAEYAQPTGDAFGAVFEAFGQLCSARLDRSLPLRSVGEAIGSAILLADCYVDEKTDRRRGAYNPIRSDRDRQQAYRLALSHLATAGWRCRDNAAAAQEASSESHDDDLLSTRIIASVFQRLAKRHERNENAPRNRHTPEMKRRAGVLDAIECCCCLELVPCWECFCCPDICCFVGIDDGCGKHRSPKRGAAPPKEVVPFGSIGFASTDIDKSGGIANIKNREYPARTEGELIQAGAQVEVVGRNAFGVIVRQIAPAGEYQPPTDFDHTT